MWQNGNTNDVLNRTPLMGEMEELCERCGKFCWKWRSSNIRQENKTRERSPWSWTWRSFRAGESCSGVGVGNAFSISQADFAGAVRVLRAPATCSV